MRLTYGSIVLFLIVTGCQPEVTTDSGGPTSSASGTSSGMGTGGSAGMGTGGSAGMGTGGSAGMGAGGSAGMGAGGSAGMGTGGSAGGGGMVEASLPECKDDSDCVLVDDCCRCAGAPAKGPLPDCPAIECFAPVCETTGLGSTKPLCRAGRCVVDADCNHAHALCNSLPPTCQPGQTAHVVNGCWGGCVAAEECREIESCTQCPAGKACVENTAFTVERHCVSVPSSCNGQIDCACMGAVTCLSPYGVCVSTSSPVLRCECINC